MKTTIVLFLALFAPSLVTATGNCQVIYPVIGSTDPVTVGGYLDICLGDTIVFEGYGEYPENGTTYDQADSTSTLSWFFGDGSFAQGGSVSYTYSAAGLYRVQFDITDVMDCPSDSIATVWVRVSGGIPVDFVPDNPALFCLDDTVTAYPVVQPVTYFPAFLSAGITPIPDGTGEVILDSLFINDFEPGQTLSATDEVEICVTMEHSWMRDLEITLKCPDGSTVLLHDHPGPIGGEVFLGEPVETDEGFPAPLPGVGYTYCWTMDAINGTWIEYANSFMPATLPPGDYSPVESLDNLIGCPVNGFWELEIQDLWGVDNGVLFYWELRFAGDLDPQSVESFEVTPDQLNWVAIPEIVGQSGDTIQATASQSTLLELEITDNFGCLSTAELEIAPLIGDPACSDCADWFINLDPGPIFFNCQQSVLELDASDATASAYIEYSWSTVSGNIITDPSLPTILVDLPGDYTYTLYSPLSGCLLEQTVTVLTDTTVPIADAGSDTTLVCSGTTLELDGTNSSQGPEFTYAWTTVDGNIISGASTLQPEIEGSGTYLLTIVNTLNGCSSADDILVTIVNDLVEEVLITEAGCDLADGSITLVPASGVNPTYTWSTGATGPIVSDLPTGWYSVTISDPSCTIEDQIFVDEDLSCKLVITGQVYNDGVAPDCIIDPDSEPVEGILIHLLPIDIYAFTDADGIYSFAVPPGNYTIQYIEDDLYNLSCPLSGEMQVSSPDPGEYIANSFWVTPFPGYNLCVEATSGPARPGFFQWNTIVVQNQGLVPVEPEILFKHDSLFEPGSLDDLADLYDPDTDEATFNVPSLNFLESAEIDFLLYLPADVALGTEVTAEVTANPLVNDAYPENNTQFWTQEVTGSYDPNDKQTFTGQTEFGGAIFETDTTIHYQIRFQNTGTDTAFTVVIRDTLSEWLDVETIRPGISTHQFELEFEGNNVLVFRFEDILLPDSTTNLEGSQGFVTFRINRRLDIPFGTEIINSAAIFFDFNAPIITNETVHILTMFVDTQQPLLVDGSLSVFPNPADRECQAVFTLEDPGDTRLYLFGSDGRLVHPARNLGRLPAGERFIPIDLSGLVSGTYFLLVKSGKQSFSGQLIVK
jgi:uncharacterized repeat protein (TIGR01451 family)